MPRILRFCHFATFYPPYSFGGDAVYVYRLVNSLAARGHEVDVVHCLDSYSVLAGRNSFPPLPHHPGVTVHTLHSRFGPLSPLLAQQTGLAWPNAGKIRRILRAKRFDVIHYHNISLFGPKLLEIDPGYTGFIRLYTTHEHWLVCPMHILWKNRNRLCDRPRCFFCTLRTGRPPQWWRYTSLLQKASESVDSFISPSRFTAELHRQRGFARPFVQLPHFAPAPEPTAAAEGPHPRPFFLFVGRLEKIKGLQNVIPLFRRYTKADLLVAGKGKYELELRRLALGLGNVVFLGWKSSRELSSIYRNAIALIVPSLCYEIFPLVLLEAFAHGTPAIVNAVGSLPEIIQESRGGLEYRNQEELLVAMGRLQRDGELRSRLGNNAYRKWEERWTEPAHYRAYFDILAEAARRKYGQVPWAEKADDV
jgi:glycosyltransferase involved in cell wall biosynthesis